VEKDTLNSPYQNVFNELDKITANSDKYTLLNGIPLTSMEGETLSSSNIHGVNNRFGMPQIPPVAQA
jgi:hypothetical protein